MKTGSGRVLGLTALVGAVVLATSVLGEATGPRPLNRSLYVPIAFTVCEHLENAILYQGEQAVGVLPARRIFQFTYYPELKQLAPKATQIRIEGVYSGGGDPFRARLAVTPEAIYTARQEIALDTSKPLSKLRYKIDTRYQTVDLHIRCDKFCSRSGHAKSERAGEELQAQGQEPR